MVSQTDELIEKREEVPDRSISQPHLKLHQLNRAVGQGVASWQTMSIHPICFYAAGKRPGELVWLGAPVFVGALKLQHLSGSISCVKKTEYASNWGCYQYPGLEQHPLNVVVTDLRGNVIFPLQKYIRNAGLWYYLPATDADSKELVFANFQSPFYLRTHSRLRIWYGEDLRNWRNRDNQGRVCVNVLGYLMN